MKRLLLIAYHFPPEPAAGALRPGYLARYLRDFGWETTVLTRPLGDPGFPSERIESGLPVSPIETRMRASMDERGAKPHSPIRSMLRSVKETLLFPDRAAPWIPGALRAADEAARKRPFDAILSTAMPASVHVIAWILSRRYNIPWIADYRDPWQNNIYYPRGFMRARLDPMIERYLLRRASRITTISEPIAQGLRELHCRNDVEVISNAYDPAEWSSLHDVKPSRFSLCYTGTMYDGKRSPDLLFGALASLRNAGDSAANVEVNFYGHGSDNVRVSADKFGVTDIVTQHGMVPRPQAMRAQRESAALLIFFAMDGAASTEMGSKFLEYIGARRPIIAFGPADSVMRPFLERYELGWFASNMTEAQAAIRAARAHFDRGEPDITVDPSAATPAPQLAARYATILDEIAQKQTASDLDVRIGEHAQQLHT